eukprot:6481818-Amphidinium_carterae.1
MEKTLRSPCSAPVGPSMPPRSLSLEVRAPKSVSFGSLLSTKPSTGSMAASSGHFRAAAQAAVTSRCRLSSFPTPICTLTSMLLMASGKEISSKKAALLFLAAGMGITAGGGNTACPGIATCGGWTVDSATALPRASKARARHSLAPRKNT